MQNLVQPEIPLNTKTMLSPLGELTLVASPKGLVAVLWPDDHPNRVRLGPLIEDLDHPILCETERQLSQYFVGTRRVFDLPFDLQGTEFQKKVWNLLMKIPYGQTASYGELARLLQNPKASRAVGSANGKNPVSIITPCHRVIGSTGALTGFAGGLRAKSFLLELEKAYACKS